MEKTSKPKVQIGHRFGNWVIMSEAKRLGRDTRYLCQCSCGKEKMVSAISLRNGSSTHCGCLRKERERTSKVCDYELKPTPPEIQEIYQMISRGCLPPADQFSMKDGAPSWTLPTLARILGISRQELIEYLQTSGDRFTMGERRPGENLFETAVS